uniref:Uncharacterized protein n=1 Tax=Solanum tuberosum TaxID=4113 RepID=M1DC85_SOLTU
MPAKAKASPQKLPRVMVKLVVMGQHLGKVALPPVSLNELQVHFHRPSSAPRLVVVPVNFRTVAPSTCNISHQAKATPRAFPRPVVMTMSREVAREGMPWLGTKLEHASLPPRVAPRLMVATKGHEDPRGRGRQ